MMKYQTPFNRYASWRPAQPGESGVALLTVLALLSIFAVVLVGFTYTIRMEEFTVHRYADSVNVQDFTEAATQGVLSQLARDLNPLNEHFVLGKPQPRYISLEDPWAIGYYGGIGKNIAWDARSHEVDIRSDLLVNRLNLKILPTPIPLGVDEDIKGDVTGRNTSGGQTGDGAPGLRLIDDDLDGVADNAGYSKDDDDEDGRVDEDGLDVRRPDSRGQAFFAAGTGYDADGDMRGVFDECAKININFAGNNFNQKKQGQFTYNMGVSPAELDLPLFLYGRIFQYLSGSSAVKVFSNQEAEQLAYEIVNYRYGSKLDGGKTFSQPGAENQDDDGNNDPQIVKVQEYNTALKTMNYDRDPFIITGDKTDNDNDGFMNEEDEKYIGPSTDNASGSPLTKAIGSNTIADPKLFRPGDKIDNNGDGYIDERDEGKDDPGEFDVVNPQGGDRPFATVDDLRLLDGIPDQEPRKNPQAESIPSLFGILRDSVTIYSQSDEMSGPLGGKNNETAKINPNSSSNWLAKDIWDRSDPDGNRADFQYSPPVRLEDLLVLQFDKDGDWQPTAESNTTDGIDNDGDGLVDEPSDDWDGNYYPSGDYDGNSEADVGAPYLRDGRDSDLDGLTTDEARQSEDAVGRLRNLTNIAGKANKDPRDLAERELRAGFVVEGNGVDDDGDGIIDDDGDFNGDGVNSYDPEWHVGEDAWGDASGDGYPGLGADPTADDKDSESRDGVIVREPSKTDPQLITSFADDDWDGFADYYDPQVLAAMFAPELDGVDNDNDGEVDEIGERYIACFDDDEDGIYDEDPPDFQLAINLMDYIDAWGPFKPAEDEDVRSILGKNDQDAVLSDPVTRRSFELYSTRQRAFRMNPWILAGLNSGANDLPLNTELMRFLLPNPPQTGMSVEFEGVEAIRINEVMAKPVIRLEAEETLDYVRPSSNANSPYEIKYNSSRFKVDSGDDDDGTNPGVAQDTSWGTPKTTINAPDTKAGVPGYIYLPEGFRNTLNRLLPIVNMDALAPAFIFAVTNAPASADPKIKVGANPIETASWRFEDIPAGVYDVVIYMHPSHKYNPEVRYRINNREISFKSDYAFGDKNGFTGLNQGFLERIRRDTAWNVYRDGEFQLHYRLTPYPPPDQSRPMDGDQRAVIGSDGVLELTIQAEGPLDGNLYATSFDRIELINLGAQYVELVNLSTDDIDLSGWTVNTPYGHYILPKDTIIKRMKPSWEDDDGKDLQPNEGMPGIGVPFENLLDPDKTSNDITTEDRRLEDNKLLLAFDADTLKKFLTDNYPRVENLDSIVVEPVLGSSEKADIQQSLQNGVSTRRPNAQLYDLQFRVVDAQEDILTDNPLEKHITLYDPAGNYVDSFAYRTTFNNVMSDILDNNYIAGSNVQNSPDLLVTPGYKGFEAYERTDPTYFETEVTANAAGSVSGKRSVPSSMKLYAKDAVIADMNINSRDGSFSKGDFGGYPQDDKSTQWSDPNNSQMKRFRTPVLYAGSSEGPRWNGWDFIGDYYRYPEDMSNSEKSYEAQILLYDIAAREAVAPGLAKNVKFYQMMGGFENSLDMTNAAVKNIFKDGNYTAFIWRMGARELIRAGYDPEVDDQLTVRVLGRQFVDQFGAVWPIDLPVGEVLVIPAYRILNPGDKQLNEQYETEDNTEDVFLELNAFNQASRKPVFAKLKNGDTVFTIDLRNDQKFDDLWSDLSNASQSETMIEIAVIMRKSTADLNPMFRSQSGGATIGYIGPLDRPDLMLPQPVNHDAKGYYPILGYGNTLAGMGDDNYFFKGIELFGRGKKDKQISAKRLAYLAGTPGRDNSGYVPAYPRRRYELAGSTRDKNDIIDNTAFVKNAPLATVGEISRLFTGNRFETVNSPIVPQRLEDKAVDPTRIQTNPELGQRLRNNNVYRLQLAQRERLDQWENQYSTIYGMITTALSGIVSGKINIDAAPRETLLALPFCPPKSPGELEDLAARYYFNAICADFVLEGRQAGGHDMLFGVHGLDDDEYLRKTKTPDTITDYKFASVGREPRGYKYFDDIESLVFNPLNIKPDNIRGDLIQFKDVYLSAITSQPDDGPYPDIGVLLAQMTHLKRRERFSEPLKLNMDRTADGVKDGAGDLRERLNALLKRDLSPEDMEAMMNRVSNLMTVRSRSFSIVTRGRIIETGGGIVAQRKLETVYQR
ncbi:MAG: hypothetical protein AB1656_08720 [Candidatus Omnitrophota bacterium]